MFGKGDSIISFFSYIYQVGIFLYAVLKCLSIKEKKDVTKWIASFFIFILSGSILSLILKSYSIIMIEVHSITFFLICGIIYRKKMHDAMLAYSICYYIYLMYSIVQEALFGFHISLKWTNIIAGILFMIIYLYSLNDIEQVFVNVKDEEAYRVFIIILSFVVDIFMVFDEITSKNQVRMLELTVVKICFVFLVINVIYFAIRYYKVKKIIQLNSKLNYMNNELRNIKDSHGRVINMMYRLYKQGNNDEIGVMLKGIINNDNKEVNAIKSEEKKNNSILDIALIGAVKDGIEVNIDEEYSLELACIDKMELYRIISNIINNARRVVGEDGVINAETHKEEDKIIITIENNGPKIDENHINKIFQAGFTTKNNNDKSHGYGLNIVKELVEKNHGHIYVESSDISTVFKIVLPCN